jgi:hypothetical protein
MDKQQYEEAKTRLEEVTRILKHEKISPEERNRLEREGKELAKIVMSPWIPFSWGHRLIMIAIAAIGLWGLMEGQYLLVLLWLLLPLFSPRVVGKCISAVTGYTDQ